MHKKLRHLIVMAALLTSFQLQSQETDHEKEASFLANEALAQGFSEKFHEDYLSSIVRYNKRTEKLSEVLADHGHKKLAQRVQNFELPKFKLQKNHKAQMKVGPHKITVSTHDLFKGQVHLNHSPFDLTGELTPERVREHLAVNTSIETSWLDLFIGKAHAQSRDPFEIAVFATMMAMQESFDDEWCLRSACAKARAKRNFDQVMKSVQEKARSCQNNPEAPEMQDLAFDITDYVEYNSGRYDFEETLHEAFNEHPVQSATCQDFVESLHKEEIQEVASRKETAGYISGLTSAMAYENREKNAKAFKDYVQEVCRPYIDLRNCLIQKRYSSIRRVYDETRRPGKDTPEDEYEVRPREGRGTGR